LKDVRPLLDREKAVRVPLSKLISEMQALLPKERGMPTHFDEWA
jgi:hypothetical protein